MAKLLELVLPEDGPSKDLFEAGDFLCGFSLPPISLSLYNSIAEEVYKKYSEEIKKINIRVMQRNADKFGFVFKKPRSNNDLTFQIQVCKIDCDAAFFYLTYCGYLRSTSQQNKVAFLEGIINESKLNKSIWVDNVNQAICGLVILDEIAYTGNSERLGVYCLPGEEDRFK